MQCEIKFSPTIFYRISCRPNACRLLLILAISTTRSQILIMEHASKEIHAVPLPKLDICMSARLAGVPPAAKKVCAVSLGCSSRQQWECPTLFFTPMLWQLFPYPLPDLTSDCGSVNLCWWAGKNDGSTKQCPQLDCSIP